VPELPGYHAGRMHLLAIAATSILLGLHGNPGRFHDQTGQQTRIVHTFISFAQTSSIAKVAANAGPVPMLALNTGSYGSRQSATPRGIALGQNDAFLIRLNGVVNDYAGDRFYVRPFPEMNAYWEANSAYNQNGSPRGAAYTTRWNRKALARIAVIVRGGVEADVNAKLAKLGLPGVHQDLAITTPKLRIVWNPQGFGAPNLAGNSAQAYYPGDAYVDVIGDDLYDIRGHGATWAAAEAMYKAHPSKAFAFPEWGLWGFDDPQFVRDMATWVRTHGRTEFIAYFAGRPGSTWDLASKPRSRAAYTSLISPLG
jgi:hypothetical protein